MVMARDLSFKAARQPPEKLLEDVPRVRGCRTEPGLDACEKLSRIVIEPSMLIPNPHERNDVRSTGQSQISASSRHIETSAVMTAARP
jgi:hypothetical protein